MGPGNSVKPWKPLILGALVLFFGAPLFHLFAQDTIPTPADARKIQKTLQKNKKTLTEIEKKLAKAKRQQQIDARAEQSVLDRLEKADQELGQLKREKETNQADLEQTRAQTDQLHAQMEISRTALEQSRDLMRKRLRDLYRMSFREPPLYGWLDSENFGDLARKLKFETLLAQSNEKLLTQTQRQNDELQESSDEWDQKEQRRQRIVQVLSEQEKTYSRKQRNRTHFLASIRKEETIRQQTIAELNDAAQGLKAKVSDLLQASEEAKKQPQYVPAGRGLAVVRGRIPWPVSGNIISPFGKTRSAEFNAIIDNTGIQIQAPAGTPFKSVAGGTVRYADWFKGYGKLVILDHGEGYYSLYAQASELDVTVGQVVAPGQQLGLVGDTGSLVGSSLYFEIRKDGQPQDPVRWLKRQSRS
jgi:septal ring factor EnvC (AmiA/AmiB activator)